MMLSDSSSRAAPKRGGGKTREGGEGDGITIPIFTRGTSAKVKGERKRGGKLQKERDGSTSFVLLPDPSGEGKKKKDLKKRRENRRAPAYFKLPTGGVGRGEKGRVPLLLLFEFCSRGGKKGETERRKTLEPYFFSGTPAEGGEGKKKKKGRRGGDDSCVVHIHRSLRDEGRAEREGKAWAKSLMFPAAACRSGEEQLFEKKKKAASARPFLSISTCLASGREGGGGGKGKRRGGRSVGECSSRREGRKREKALRHSPQLIGSGYTGKKKEEKKEEGRRTDVDA